VAVEYCIIVALVTEISFTEVIAAVLDHKPALKFGLVTVPFVSVTDSFEKDLKFDEV
jgi:hypothetical protein